ncbi:hypothetical protein LTS10_010352 [Elasticomyces elasticus]|nr:hypothetical protein LTS10_010352 [Elasticomyces elasticus]
MPPPVRFSGKASVLRFPGLGEPPLYQSFLKTFIRMYPSPRAFAGLSKDELDNKYESLLRDRLGDIRSEHTIEQYLADTRTRQSQQIWDAAQAQFPQAILLSPNVQNLNLSTMGTNPNHSGGRGSLNENWERQTYEQFARKTRKMNPGVVFSKDMMDDAFRLVASRATKLSKSKKHPSLNPAELERMMKRCLGDESDEYWAEQPED